MGKLTRVLLAVVVTAAAGFAAASIVTGRSLADVLTGTTATTVTTTTETTATTTSPSARRVTICHITGSKKHPAVTITVSQSAVAAHIAHGDRLGKCTGTETARAKHRNHKHKGSNSNAGSRHHNNGSGHGKGK